MKIILTLVLTLMATGLATCGIYYGDAARKPVIILATLKQYSVGHRHSLP